MGVLPAGCGFGDAEQITLGYLTWDENVAVSNLTKVLLERDLGYENVELKRAAKVLSVYEMVGNAEADAFQDTWMPNQAAELEAVEDEVELLDPWFKGTTKFSIATPAYMDVSSLSELNGSGAEYILGIESDAEMMDKISSNAIPEYGLEQKLIEADTEAMLVEVDKLYRFEEPFAFVAWSPHWMNQVYDFDYLDDPKGSLGRLTKPSDVSTIVREDFRREDPVAYTFMDRMDLTEAEVTSLQAQIREAGDPIRGTKIWLRDNRDVVGPWIEAARAVEEG
jgi:glycine betaine/proline transport system substrate-binding protein